MSTMLALQFRWENHQKPALTVDDLLSAVSKHEIQQREYTNEDKQKLVLGRFYRKNTKLPVFAEDHDTIDMKLFGLFDTGDYASRWRKSSELPSRPTVYIGVTGAGKTFQILKHAANGFVCYTTAADLPNESDKYYMRLINAFTLLTHIENLDVKADIATSMMLLWIITKLACLYSQLINDENFTPLQFAASQIGTASEYYADCFYSCLMINASTNFFQLETIHTQLVQMIRTKTKYPIGIAFDEAQIMLKQYNQGYFLAQPTTEENPSKYRDLLYGVSYICTQLQDNYDYIAFAGTQLSLVDAGAIQEKNKDIFLDFPYYPADTRKLTAIFNKLIDMTECTVSKDAARKLNGRPRTLCYAVQLLRDTSKTQNVKKQQLLDEAINESYTRMSNTIFEDVFWKLYNHAHTDKIIYFLCKIIIARAIDKNFGVKVSVPPLFDYVNAGIFHLRYTGKDKKDMFAAPNEPLGIDVVCRLLDDEYLAKYIPQDFVAYKINKHDLGARIKVIDKDNLQSTKRDPTKKSVLTDMKNATEVEIEEDVQILYKDDTDMSDMIETSDEESTESNITRKRKADSGSENESEQEKPPRKKIRIINMVTELPPEPKLSILPKANMEVTGKILMQAKNKKLLPEHEYSVLSLN